MGLTAFFAMSVNAQTTLRVKNSYNRAMLKSETNGNNAAKSGVPIQVNQIAANITCAEQYTAGTLNTFNLTLSITNAGNEYGDSLNIMFPAGFTPTAAMPSDSLGVSEAPTPAQSGCPDSNSGTKEPFRGILGQEVIWGNNDNCWGGLPSGTNAGSTMTLAITCNIGAGVTGPQVVSFHISGDGFGAGPGDLTSTFTIQPAGAVVVDMKTKLLGVITNTATGTVAGVNNCGLTTHLIVSQIHNLGTNPMSIIPCNYSVNGVAAIAPTTYTGTINPGDSAFVFFDMPYNFSANNIYKIKAWTDATNESSRTNDTAAATIVNSNPVALTSTTYSNGIESAYDFASITQSWSGLGLGFSNQTSHVHSGAKALFYTINNTTMGAPNGTYETMNILPCMDVTTGETYRISFWKKSATSGTLAVNGQTGVFSGLTNDIASMTDVLKAYSALTPTNASGPLGWTKDSVDYVAASTGTRYFAIGGKGVLSAAGQQINVRLDDIKITKIITTGIKNNALADAITLFPNPSTGLLNINNVEAISTIEVYNVIGDKVYSNKLDKGNNSIDLSNLANGSYFVKINSNNNVMTKKVVISK